MNSIFGILKLFVVVDMDGSIFCQKLPKTAQNCQNLPKSAQKKNFEISPKIEILEFSKNKNLCV
jgi:hypothetical protein